ncbi:ABC multidrug transporter SitT [Anopheles sinensis]|uniref:ABC multidrug transporter SitT n=1 Tax=Anopheles sinensis TaxID=74873 RepID=A0A084WS91_ANOSI|nr:ABC multidrug transporter SitT [Anopheles sinensis]
MRHIAPTIRGSRKSVRCEKRTSSADQGIATSGDGIRETENLSIGGGVSATG